MKLKKQQDEAAGPSAVPETLQKLASLTLITRFEDLDKRLRAEAEEKDRVNREKIDALLVRLTPVDAELRKKIETFRGLMNEYMALAGDVQKARNAFTAEGDRLDAKVKAGALTYSAKLDAAAEARAKFENHQREAESKAEPLLKTIRDLDDEIKALQLEWSELELEIVTAAEEAQLTYFRGIERRLQEFKPVIGGARTFSLLQNVKTRRRMTGNYKRGAVTWGMSLKIKAEDIPMMLTDSRIPDKYLGQIREIIMETEKQKRDIMLNITADTHPAPGVSWSYTS